MKNIAKVVGLAALGGVLGHSQDIIAAIAQVSSNHAAEIIGIVAAIAGLFVHPPKKADAPSDPAKVFPMVVLLLFCVPMIGSAQGFKAASCTTSPGDVTITTTTEKVAITSPIVPFPLDAGDVTIMGWAQVTTGGSTTALTPMIRRGTAITDTAITEANVEQVKAAAGSTEFLYTIANEQRTAASAQYVFTVKQTGAAADGTILQSGICVFVR